MPLKLMYITNRPEVARIAEDNGADRIFVDMEYIGKDKRQGGLDSVKNHHTVSDVKTIRSALRKAELLVRINPIHDATDDYPSSEDEIKEVAAAGADIIMLPYFKTAAEVRRFLKALGGKCRAMLLLETPEAASILDEILEIKGIDEIHIGINDLSLGMGKKFMFELLADGTVEELCRKMEEKGMFYGFGGTARPGGGLVPAEMIIKEHYRLGSSMVILSRAFCDVNKAESLKEIEKTFAEGVAEIRALEKECEEHARFFRENRKLLREAVERAVKG